MALQNSINAPTPLSTANGGTGNAVTIPAMFTAGRVWIGNGTVNPPINRLRSGPGINVTNAAGGITVSNIAPNVPATVLPNPTTSQALAVNTTYITTNTSGGITTFTLPSAGSTVQLIRIIGSGTQGWRINSFNPTTGVSHIINVGGVQTTAVTGSVSSKNPYDSIILCRVAVAPYSWIGVPLSGTLNIV